MAHINESARAGGTLGEEQNPKRQSRFQGHWDAAGSQGSRLQSQGNIHVEIPAATQAYDWGLLAAGSKATPGTAGGLGGLQTFTGAIGDDWSDLLSQTGTGVNSGTRSAGYQSLGRLNLGDASGSASPGFGGDTVGATPRQRRQFVDIIQGDFPRTPSPSVDTGARARAGGGSARQATPGDSGLVAEPSALEPDGGAHAPSSSAFSSLATSAPTRSASLASPPNVLTDANILGISSRRASAAPPSRSHSTVLGSGTADSLLAPNVGMMVSSLLDQEDEIDRRKSQADMFGMAVGSPLGSAATPSSSAAAPGQSLWAARHAARLDSFQRAASTPPRNAAAVSAGATPSADMWSTLDMGGAGQPGGGPGSLLRENSLLGNAAAGHPLTPGALSASNTLNSDDLSNRIRGLRLGDENAHGLRSADLRGPHDIFGDMETPTTARAHGSITSVSDQWDLGPPLQMQPPMRLQGQAS
ncbi:hypothetical protein IWW55_004246, partial [Coemansia sp. RSA 2706]